MVEDDVVDYAMSDSERNDYYAYRCYCGRYIVEKALASSY